MFFSIIIPIYNSEKYLRQCIDSILAQTCSDFEVILVNDGSKDGSPQICDQYCVEDTRFHVLHRKKSGGAAAARNTGTSMASGEYIIYIDSDDYIEDAMFLADMREQAEKGYDVICYKFRKYYEDTGEMTACNFSIPTPIEGETIGNYVNRLVKNDAFFVKFADRRRRDLPARNRSLVMHGFAGRKRVFFRLLKRDPQPGGKGPAWRRKRGSTGGSQQV